MEKREELLAYIEQMKAEDETAKTYGDSWKRRDWKTRQSMKAGELCIAVGSLTKAEAKKARVKVARAAVAEADTAEAAPEEPGEDHPRAAQAVHTRRRSSRSPMDMTRWILPR